MNATTFYVAYKPLAYINQRLVALNQTPSFTKNSLYKHHTFA
jgi:uncharacterized circularly permuted ATP-grasp superfamily protein